MKRKSNFLEKNILKSHHQFIRKDIDHIDEKILNENAKKSKLEKEIGEIATDDHYGEYLAKNYYKKLFKEFALIDLSKYETGKFGLRWRSKSEVISGKGQTICSSLICPNTSKLNTYEMNFFYKENAEEKQALVKIRCCKECEKKLNFKVKYKTKNENMD